MKKLSRAICVGLGLGLIFTLVVWSANRFKTVPSQRTIEKQADFQHNQWAKPIENTHTTGIVLEQRVFGSGIYQIKVKRDNDGAIILAFAGKAFSTNEQVKVGMYQFKHHKDSFTELVHFIE